MSAPKGRDRKKSEYTYHEYVDKFLGVTSGETHLPKARTAEELGVRLADRALQGLRQALKELDLQATESQSQPF